MKALMGIEYTALIGLLFLFLTLSGSSLAPRDCGICGQSTSICPDGVEVSCANSCAAGACLTCSPDCSGHQGSEAAGAAQGTSGSAGGGSLNVPIFSSGDEESGSQGAAVGSGGDDGRSLNLEASYEQEDDVPLVPQGGGGSTLQAFGVQYKDKLVIIFETLLRGTLTINEVLSVQEVRVPLLMPRGGSARVSFQPSRDVTDVELTGITYYEHEAAAARLALRALGREEYQTIELKTNIQDSLKEIALEFTVPRSWIDEFAGGDHHNIQLSRLNDDGTLTDILIVPLYFYPDKPPNDKVVKFRGRLPSTSLFVINAQDIVKGPTLCNGNGFCGDIVGETVATCPSDCSAAAPSSACT
ncbi:MAG: hypothetical protein HY369_03395, partial [Candidatus Aenigmarchaeota archaeon]|nr:hypothetical protein [Candidatus Aenigmarchaeota archaeon]